MTYFRLITKALLVTVVLCFPGGAWAKIITINWQAIGGADEFERQATRFSPINVNSFAGFSTDGHWKNLVGTENSSIEALIYLRLDGIWTLFAEDPSVRGPYSTTSSLDNFTFYSLDFTSGAIDGINITNSGAGASRYVSMNSNGFGTNFYFEATEVPLPSTFVLFLSGLTWFGGRVIGRGF